MTSIEWLIKELYTEMNMSGDGRVLDEILEEAKEMHKQEIIDAHLLGLIRSLDMEATKQANEYYQETFVSKGSEILKENHIVETNEMISSQIEISDEEITKYVKSNNPYPSTKQGSMDWEHGFITAIDWYREQLKKK